MMITINKDCCCLTNDKKGLLTEASSCGLKPGEWPMFIAVLDDSNNGFLFQQMQVDEEGGKYQTKDGSFELIVLND